MVDVVYQWKRSVILFIQINVKLNLNSLDIWKIWKIFQIINCMCHIIWWWFCNLRTERNTLQSCSRDFIAIEWSTQLEMIYGLITHYAVFVGFYRWFGTNQSQILIILSFPVDFHWTNGQFTWNMSDQHEISHRMECWKKTECWHEWSHHWKMYVSTSVYAVAVKMLTSKHTCYGQFRCDCGLWIVVGTTINDVIFSECENKLCRNLLIAIIIQHSHTFVRWHSAYIWPPNLHAQWKGAHIRLAGSLIRSVTSIAINNSYPQRNIFNDNT